MKRVVVREPGGPESLEVEEAPTPAPGPGEVLLRQHAVGLNYIDVYYRTGLYKAPDGLPFVPGQEGAGVVAALGEGVTAFRVGDRVAYTGPLGAYAEERVIAAGNLVKLPDSIDFETGAAIMLKGLTAQYLLRHTFPVRPGHTILFHAAAGGVGLIATQWAKHLGATVIGTVGSPEKAKLARANGCDHVIDYRRENFVQRVSEITNGAKCDVVYDSVGQATFPGSLDCLKPRGLFVSYGQSSGPITDFSLAMLAQKGSLFATRPTLFTFLNEPGALERMSGDLMGVIGGGQVRIAVNARYPLERAADAHRALEARETTGSTVLLS